MRVFTVIGPAGVVLGRRLAQTAAATKRTITTCDRYRPHTPIVLVTVVVMVVVIPSLIIHQQATFLLLKPLHLERRSYQYNDQKSEPSIHQQN